MPVKEKKPCTCKFLHVTAGLLKVEPHKVRGYLAGQCPICMALWRIEPESMSRERIFHN